MQQSRFSNPMIRHFGQSINRIRLDCQSLTRNFFSGKYTAQRHISKGALGLAFSMLVMSCTFSQPDRGMKTIFVAQDYLIYQNQRFSKMTDRPDILNCEKSVDLFLTPLVDTSKARFSEVTSEFLRLCGQPESISIQFESPESELE